MRVLLLGTFNKICGRYVSLFIYRRRKAMSLVYAAQNQLQVAGKIKRREENKTENFV